MPPATPFSRFRDYHRQAWQPGGRARLLAGLYLLIAPTVIGTVLFTYYPNFDVFIRAFYRWNDAEGIEELVGWANFSSLLQDVRFWESFELALILLTANFIKMWPSILAAVLLHRLSSDRWRYLLQVLFVMPMVIPTTIWLLMWKNFLDPNIGIINRALNASGGMTALRALDHGMERFAEALMPLNQLADRVFGGTGRWTGLHGADGQPAALGLVGAALFGGLLILLSGRTIPALARSPALWILAILGLLVCEEKFLYLAASAVLLSRLPPIRSTNGNPINVVKTLGWVIAAAFSLLFAASWLVTGTTHAFDTHAPVWLGHTSLVVPTLIFWGFPWISTVSVLIYLAGLQQIPLDVYEAGKLDGLTSWGQFRHIEFPFLLTQIRIMLIIMTVGTLSDYGSILLLMGPNGGPDGRAMVPGLYMYNQAFQQGRFGYACAIGVFMFALILVITGIYQKYVRVEK